MLWIIYRFFLEKCVFNGMYFKENFWKMNIENKEVEVMKYKV